MNGDDDSYNAFINGIMGFSYEGPDMNGNEINITLFANSLTNKAHQRDEYAFISNAIFASLLTDEAYEVAELGSYSGGSGKAGGNADTSSCWRTGSQRFTGCTGTVKKCCQRLYS